MIEAELSRTADGLASRLTRKAAALAEAAIASRRLARRAEPSRWRSARLLWPLFTKD
jgi:hypothetical protein